HRSISSLRPLPPTSTIATPTPTSGANPPTPQSTPTAGPVASNATNALTLTANNGLFSGTLAPGQAVWYRFFYGNPGADATVSISIAPTADNADLNIYAGTDPTNLGPTQKGAPQTKNSNTISRNVNVAAPQSVFL